MFHHNPQINPIYRKGTKDTAVLLLHGFTGTPDCLRHQANHLHAMGFTVSAPLLAGHGTTRENLARTGWPEWNETCQNAFLDLNKDHAKVFVAGLSLGGLLALKLAEDHPDEVKALACLATPVFLKAWALSVLPLVTRTPLKHLHRYQKKGEPDVKDPAARKNFWNISDMPLSCIDSLTKLQKLVRRQMHRVICPAIIIHSRYDSTAPFSSLNYITKHISSSVTEAVTLENSFHIITIDYEKEIVSEKLGAFFQRF